MTATLPSRPRHHRPDTHRLAEGEQVVVVGFGPVAGRFLDEMLPEVEAGRVGLTVVGAETEPAYNRVLVGEHAVGRVSQAELSLTDAAELRAAGVRVLLGTSVTGVDRAERVVRAVGPSGAVVMLPFDRLVLVTGADPTLPATPGLSEGGRLIPGATPLRDLADAAVVRRARDRGDRVVVWGGGVLGVEASLALGEEGCPATLVHRGGWPMGAAVSETAGRLLARSLAGQGVELVGEADVIGVERDEDGAFAGLHLDGGRVVRGDLLVVSCGVRPRVDVARTAGLRTARGVRVGHDLAADVAGRIFAIGDCADLHCDDAGCAICGGARHLVGLIGPGWQQADWLARKCADELAGVAPEPSWTPTRPAALRLKSHTIEFVTAGQCGGPLWSAGSDPARVVEWADGSAGTFVRLDLRADRSIAGYQVLGLPRTAAEVGLMYERHTPVPADASVLLRLDALDIARPRAAEFSPASTVCQCAGVAHATISEAVEQGAATVDAVRMATRAGSGCGTCRRDVEAIIAAAKEKSVA